MHTVSIAKSKTAVLSVRTITMTALAIRSRLYSGVCRVPGSAVSCLLPEWILSDLPALIGAFAFGPLAGVLIELVKERLAAFFNFYRRHWGTGKFSDERILCFYRWTDLWVS